MCCCATAVAVCGCGVDIRVDLEFSLQAAAQVGGAVELNGGGGRTVVGNASGLAAFVVDRLVASIQQASDAELCESRSGSQGSQCNYALICLAKKKTIN